MIPNEVTVNNENNVQQRMYDKIPKTYKKRKVFGFFVEPTIVVKNLIHTKTF
jgi:hypothetical protein